MASALLVIPSEGKTLLSSERDYIESITQSGNVSVCDRQDSVKEHIEMIVMVRGLSAVCPPNQMPSMNRHLVIEVRVLAGKHWEKAI